MQEIVKTQIRRLKDLGICNMMDLEKVRYYAKELKLNELADMVEKHKMKYRMMMLAS